MLWPKLLILVFFLSLIGCHVHFKMIHCHVVKTIIGGHANIKMIHCHVVFSNDRLPCWHTSKKINFQLNLNVD